VLDGANALAGHAAPEPVQLSATSQAPVDERQTVLDGWNASAGHAPLAPVQFSATSQTSALDRQTVLDETKASAGQLAKPLQFSATSQTPVDDRHTKLVGRNASAGQLAVPPVQASGRSHAPAAERQTVPLGENESAGQVWLTPLQTSAMSHPPAAERQTVPDGAVPPPHVELAPVHVDDAEHAAAPVHAVPFGWNWQLASQQDAGVPFRAPSSHCSPWLGWTEPLPQAAPRACGAMASRTARAAKRKTPIRGRRSSSVECMRGCSTARASKSSW
jgi:hypothetical protein